MHKLYTADAPEGALRERTVGFVNGGLMGEGCFGDDDREISQRYLRPKNWIGVEDGGDTKGESQTFAAAAKYRLAVLESRGSAACGTFNRSELWL